MIHLYRVRNVNHGTYLKQVIFSSVSSDGEMHWQTIGAFKVEKNGPAADPRKSQFRK